MTQTARRSTVVGVFHERDDAREAIEALKDADFAPDTISILSPDKQATQDMAEETGTHAGSGAATGAVAGGILGGLGGWLVGIGALAIPGAGPFIAAGAFATALGGAAIGAGVGAIAGALTIPRQLQRVSLNTVVSAAILLWVGATLLIASTALTAVALVGMFGAGAAWVSRCRRSRDREAHDNLADRAE